MAAPVPTQITLHKVSQVLEVAFDDGATFRLPAEYLRTHSPSAEVQGHGPGQRTLVYGRKYIKIMAIEPVGNYAVLLRFDDGHASGIFSWDVLHELGREQDKNWQAYLAALEAAGLSREPGARPVQHS
ncbi:gamma-butyrobetaine hydroxylase-like domain-containing protein [Dokdonella sp.]|uniref:gamma-butyrobetaine hydroxylase-like domain-containing protein n=1 Tax=Dokdonella sp. TaxID=2291710 RepID=UPI0031C2F58D|nr:DUF971 domain-containing protein [Dokdonella sp.]